MYILLAVINSIIIATTVQAVQAYACFKSGDSTAKNSRRMTLNPLSHISIPLTLFLPALCAILNSLIILNGAKPVPFNAGNCKNLEKTRVIVSLFGTCVPFLFFIAWCIPLVLDLFDSDLINKIIFLNARICFFLGLINFYPLPPLLGGNFIVWIMPSKIKSIMSRTERYSFFILFGSIIIIYDPIIVSISTAMQRLLL